MRNKYEKKKTKQKYCEIRGQRTKNKFKMFIECVKNIHQLTACIPYIIIIKTDKGAQCDMKEFSSFKIFPIMIKQQGAPFHSIVKQIILAIMKRGRLFDS